MNPAPFELLWRCALNAVFPDIVVESVVSRVPDVGAIRKAGVGEQPHEIVIAVLHMGIHEEIHVEGRHDLLHAVLAQGKQHRFQL